MTKQFLRRGMSLLEVILAIAILGGALTVIGQLLRIGSRNAAMARDLTLAQLYCETKVNEVLIGSILPEAVSDMQLDETSARGEWLYKIETAGTDTPGIIGVTVTVGQNPNMITRPVSYSISRLIVDPQMANELATQDATLKQAFADAKTAAEGPMSGTIAYTPVTAVPTGASGGGGGGGGGQGGGRDRGGQGGEDGGRGRDGGGRGGEDGGRGRDGRGRGGEDGGRGRDGRGRGGEDGGPPGREGRGGDDGGRGGRGGENGGERGGLRRGGGGGEFQGGPGGRGGPGGGFQGGGGGRGGGGFQGGGGGGGQGGARGGGGGGRGGGS